MTPLCFNQAYRDHRQGVARYLGRRCDGHRLEIDDVLQATFLQAWRIWERRETDNVRAWLIGIARRVFAHMVRAARRRIGWDGLTVEWVAAADQRAVGAVQEDVVYLGQLRTRFAEMRPVHGAVMLGLAAGLDCEDIAHQRGVSASAVRMIRATARRQLGDPGIDI